jgi:hypothetical protein
MIAFWFFAPVGYQSPDKFFNVVVDDRYDRLSWSDVVTRWDVFQVESGRQAPTECGQLIGV